jgi:lipoprotein-anchoring transpeptidase ErfK/SrfK
MRVIALLCCALALAGRPDPSAEAQGAKAEGRPLRSDAPVVSEVLATQIALDRAGFSPGEIDGRAGKNFDRALAAYKQSHEDELSLVGDVPPLIDYTITDADVAGPFTPDIPPNLPDQAALDALNYRNPLEAIAERFHGSPALLRQLNPQATFQKAGERITVPNVAPPALPAAEITVFVTKSTSALTIEDSKGQILFHAPVTSGSVHDPLPIGTWKVNGVQRNPKFHYNPDLFWDATPGDRKATLQPGPNNPVGIVWIDLSKPHYGIHGAPEPSKIGHVESHGCVRLTNWDADRVAQWVKPGTRVVFRE